MRTIAALLALTVTACSPDSAPTAAEARIPRPMPQPAHVRIVGGTVAEGSERTAIVSGQTWIGEELVTLQLENDGGPGRYQLEFWGRDESGLAVLWHTTFPTNTSGLRTELVTLDVDVPYRPSGGPPRVELVVLFTYQPDFSRLETSRFTVVDRSE